MKKLLIVCFLAMLLLSPALAEQSRVVDRANLLTADEESALAQHVGKIAAENQFDVIILTVQSTGGKSVALYAADFFDDNGYGYGAAGDGLLFIISMEGRDYCTVTHGRGIGVFTDYGIEQMEKDIVGDLSDGEYYAAFDRYLGHVETYLRQAETGEPFDIDNPAVLRTPAQRLSGAFPIILIVALIIAGITLGVFYAQMKTARRKGSAADYVDKNSFHLTRQQDIYLYTSTVRRKIETESSSSGSRGGSSTFKSSGGGTFGGGKGGKF